MDQRGNSKPSSSSVEVKENLSNSSWLMEGIRGSSIGVSVGSSWVKSGSKLLTSSAVFWIRIMVNYSLVATTDTTAEGPHYHSFTHMIELFQGLTILGLKGGSNSLRLSFSQSMPVKKAWLITAFSPPSEATQPSRRAGFLVNNCKNQRWMYLQTCEYE